MPNHNCTGFWGQSADSLAAILEDRTSLHDVGWAYRNPDEATCDALLVLYNQLVVARGGQPDPPPTLGSWVGGDFDIDPDSILEKCVETGAGLGSDRVDVLQEGHHNPNAFGWMNTGSPDPYAAGKSLNLIERVRDSLDDDTSAPANPPDRNRATSTQQTTAPRTATTKPATTKAPTTKAKSTAYSKRK